MFTSLVACRRHFKYVKIFDTGSPIEKARFDREIYFLNRFFLVGAGGKSLVPKTHGTRSYLY